MKKIYFIAFFLVFFSTSSVFAQATGLAGFDLFELRPSGDGSGTPYLAGAKLLGPQEIYAGLSAGYHRRNLSNTLNGAKNWLSDYAFEGDLVGSVGIFEFLSIGFDLPGVAYQQNHHFSTGLAEKNDALGDLAANMKWRLWEEGKIAPGIAFIPSVIFPTGEEFKMTGNKTFKYQGILAAEKNFGPLYAVANVGYRIEKQKAVLATILNDRLLFGAGIGVPLPVWEKSLELFVEGHGETIVTNFSKSTTPLEALGGARKTFKNGLSVELAGSGGVQRVLGTSQFRVLAGVGYRLPLLSKKKG